MTNFLEKLKKGMEIEKIPEIAPAASDDNLSEASLAPQKAERDEETNISDKPRKADFAIAEISRTKNKIPSIEDLTKEELTMPSSVSEKIKDAPKKKKEAKSKKEKKTKITKQKNKTATMPEIKNPIQEKSKNEIEKINRIKIVKEKKSGSKSAFVPLSSELWQGEEGQLVIDLYQSDGDLVVESPVGGVGPENLDISIDNDMLKIKGRREKTFEEKKENYFYQECHWGAFSREIILPVEIDAGKAEAVIKNGILTIKIPIIEKIDKKKLKVKEIE